MELEFKEVTDAQNCVLILLKNGQIHNKFSKIIWCSIFKPYRQQQYAFQYCYNLTYERNSPSLHGSFASLE